jgi:hypothetical protein
MINHWVSVGTDFSLPPANSPWNPTAAKGSVLRAFDRTRGLGVAPEVEVVSAGHRSQAQTT